MRPNAISWVLFALIAIPTAALSGQQPKPREPEPYVAPLLPAEDAWRITLDAPPAAGGALDEHHVYVPVGPVTLTDADGETVVKTGSESIRAFDRQTGALRWTTTLATALPPVVAGDLLLVAAADQLHALARMTGAPVWSVPLARPLRAPMLVRGNRLLALSEPDELVSLTMDTRQIAWRRPIAETGTALMTADDRAVYLTTTAGQVLSVRLLDGSIAWERRIEGVPSEPAVGHDRVLVGSTSRTLTALDPETGKVEWAWPGRMIGGDVIGAAVTEDTVYVVALDNTLRALNRSNGNQRWRVRMPTRPLLPPRVFHGTVVITGLSPNVLTFLARTGTAVSSWAAPESAELQGPPLIDGNLKPFGAAIVVITRDGLIAALRPTQMKFAELPTAALSALPGRALPPDRLPAHVEQYLRSLPPPVPLLASPLDGRFNELPGRALPIEPPPR